MLSRRRKEQAHQNKPHENKITSQTPFAVTEAYKVVRTNMQFALAAQEGKAVVISSPTPGDGKSTTAANISITLAQTSARILLIDADLRKPVQHKIFQVDNTHGLSRLLVGFETLGDCIKRDVEPGIDLITSGPLPPNPSELLGSPNMTTLIQKMHAYYDYILIDSPPVNIVTDAILLAVKCAGIIIVARQNATTYDDLGKTIEFVKSSKSNILGVVITDAHDRNKSYKRTKKYTYKYDYRYGENS